MWLSNAIGAVRMLVYALAGWITEHGDQIELRLIPGEHHYVEFAERTLEAIDDHAAEIDEFVGEALHDFGLS